MASLHCLSVLTTRVVRFCGQWCTCGLRFFVALGLTFRAQSAPYHADPAFPSSYAGSFGSMGSVPPSCVIPIIARYWCSATWRRSSGFWPGCSASIRLSGTCNLPTVLVLWSNLIVQRHKQKWPTSGQGGYITPSTCGVPTALERGAESEEAHKWARWLHNPCRLGDPHRFRAGVKSEVAHKWARWLHNPCRLGGPHRFRARGRIASGPEVGKVAT